MKPQEPPNRSNPSVESEAAAREAAALERSLVARSQAGDQDAFRCLVERHRDRAYGLALRIVRSPADAEEVAQDAFVRAWLALPRFRGEASFATWLHRIVARRALDRLAVLRRRIAREADLESAPEAAGTRAADDDAESRARALERLMERLSETQRAVVTMFYYQDRSVEQVAAGLGIPQGTVKTHLSRARAALREGWMRQMKADAE